LRLIIGIGSILILTIIVGVTGWYTLESQTKSQLLANAAIDLVSSLKDARQNEKNYILRDNQQLAKSTVRAINSIKSILRLILASDLVSLLSVA
ncbi:hypothetical protein JHD49_00005, partial [Sulfurimonas sp. SAG-AH-194-C21]